MIFAFVIWRTKILFFLVIITTTSRAFGFDWNCGIKIGVNLSLGTHADRLGIMCGSWIVAEHIQFNGIIHGNFSIRSYGPQKQRFELQTTEGVEYVFGRKSLFRSNVALFNSTSNFTRYGYGFGYSLKQYWDKVGLKQPTAILHVNLQHVTLVHENDAFLFSYIDKYRTGAFSLRYEFDSRSFENVLYSNAISMKVQLFTGNSLSENSVRRTDTTYPSSNGYLDLSNAECGSCSNGILMVEYETVLPLKQNARIQFGIDDERIRNQIQNKWIHEMKFVPKFFRGKANAYIPMVDTEGKPFLFDPNQSIRKARPFLQLGLNEPLFW